MSNNLHSQNFGSLTSKIFFDVDVEKKDAIFTSEFSSKPELTEVEQTGWTMYPPTDEKGNLIPFYIFSFTRHPTFFPNFKKGRLMVLSDKESGRVIGMSLSILFESKEAFDSTFQNITKLYEKYSVRSIKRPNILRPIEIIKFISSDNIDYVIITKDEDDKGFYMNFAYNYQGYEW